MSQFGREGFLDAATPRRRETHDENKWNFLRASTSAPERPCTLILRFDAADVVPGFRLPLPDIFA
jgi:hypothetical protein